jgi:ADP-heptose:LPS heptosyltransferase
LGNLLLLTPLLQEIETILPDCKIDLFIKGGLGPIVFKNYNSIGTIIKLPKKPFKEIVNYIKIWKLINNKQYDLVINVDEKSSSGRLSAQFSNSNYKIFGNDTDNLALVYDDYSHFAKFSVYNFRNLISKLGYSTLKNPVPSLNIKLSDSEIQFGKKTLLNLVKNDKKTICIFTYATGEKCYSELWWSFFYEKLQKNFCDYNIIEILPIENISKINFKAPTFYSNDVRDMASLLANVSVFIGADSGIMHLASASLVPTVGLFSVTNPDKYKPYSNNSIAIDTNKTSTDECMIHINTILEKC